MKVIIAGSRDDTYSVEEIQMAVDKSGFEVTTLISGQATGVDSSAEEWAKSKNIPVLLFPADWKRYGKKAGPIRNAKMAVAADALIALPGGKGTQDMKNKIKAYRKLLFVWSKDEEV